MEAECASLTTVFSALISERPQARHYGIAGTDIIAERRLCAPGRVPTGSKPHKVAASACVPRWGRLFCRVLAGCTQASPDQQISLTDPDSRSMATSGRGSGVVGYNVQVVVDTEHHLIVTHEVTNSGSDRAQRANMAKQAKAVLKTEILEPMSVKVQSRHFTVG